MGELERRVPELPVLLGDQEAVRLGVVELVRDFCRCEPPRNRMQDRARLGAGEHQRDMLARVAGQRRDARAVLEPGGELLGTRVELGVRPAPIALDDRGALRRDARAIAKHPLDGQLAHCRNSEMILTNASGCSQKKRCPALSNR